MVMEAIVRTLCSGLGAWLMEFAWSYGADGNSRKKLSFRLECVMLLELHGGKTSE